MSAKEQKRHPKKNSGSALKIIIIVFALLLALLIAGGAAFLRHYRPSLDTDTPPFDVPTVSPGENPGEEGDDTDTSDDDEYVRDIESVNFLVAGRDKNAWNTDVMMLVNFNMREGSLSVLQIPRDTYIEIENIHGRVNTMVKTMRQAAYNEDRTLSSNELMHEGMKRTAALLEKSLCVQIDGYAIVNLEGFRNIINVIGGVYMDVPFDMDYEDPDQDLYIHLKKGPQLLDGKEAEMFVRFRAGFVQGDIGRVDAQKIFLTALFKQLKSNLTISTVPALVQQLVKYVITDIAAADVVIYAKELLGVDMDNISMVTLPGQDARSHTTGAWYYVMHRADTLAVINKYFNVYNKDITDELFDPTHAFNVEDYPLFNEIYFAPPSDVTVENAGDIDSGGIDIPMN